MYHLIDTFNNRRISSHRTIEAMVKADNKYADAVARANGSSSYIPTQYRVGGSQRNWRTESSAVDIEAVMHARG
jgi:hypothetical protein